jgi:glycosyltransferase involved in cell wall biosynthesis
MDVIYSIGAKLGHGIGMTSYHAIEQIKKVGYLKKAITLDDIPIQSNDSITKDNTFDVLASLKISKPVNVVHAWGNMAYSQILKGHSLDAKTIVERASSHVNTQNRILLEEYKRFGYNSVPIHPWVIKKSLAEFKETDFVTVPSQFAYDSFLEEGYPEHKLLLNPFGVDTEKFQPNPINHDKFTAIFIGENWIRKNVYRLEQAWSNHNLKESKLIIRSNAPIFNDIEYKSIEVTSWVQNIQDFYNMADVFIMPSLEEGCCLVVLEALASGVPVIISKQTGVEITDGKEGFYVDPYNIKELQDKISYFFENKDEIKRMGKEARNYSLKQTWSSYGDRLIKNYDFIGNDI